MKKRRALLIAMGMLIALSLWAPVQAAVQVWTTPQKITSAGAWFRGGPVVNGDKVYFNDRRSGKSEIYVWDQTGGERLYMSGTLSTSVRAVYGEKVVFSTYNSGQYSLYLHDPATGDTLISPTYSGSGSAIYGDTVAFEDNRSGFQQVYTWDPVNGERHLNPTNYDQMNPKIWNGKVVYEDYRLAEQFGDWTYNHPNIYTWDAQNGTQYLAYDMKSPVIYQDRIYASEPGWLTQLTPTVTRLASGIGGVPTGVWGDLVVMQGGHSWDPVNGLVKIADSVSYYDIPRLYDKTAAWAYNNNIYVSNFVPEPSALCSLGMLLAGTCVTLRRRRRA